VKGFGWRPTSDEAASTGAVDRKPLSERYGDLAGAGGERAAPGLSAAAALQADRTSYDAQPKSSSKPAGIATIVDNDFFAAASQALRAQTSTR
jgi:hypothetical protein